MAVPLLLALVTAWLLASPGAAAAAPVRSASGPEVTVVARGLQVPWDVAFLPDGRALVTERAGRVRIVSADGRLLPQPAATVTVTAVGDGGLLGIAVDPAFSASRPFVYLSASVDGELQIQRWRLVGDLMVRDAVILHGVRAVGSVHTSGRVRFGPDGALYMGTGDSGDGDSAQASGSLDGRILRIAPGAYLGGAVAPEVVAKGLRHPQGLAWQPGTGRLWVTDHGPSGFDGPSGDDELDLITPGGNYGWPLVRGADHKTFLAPAHLWTTTIAPAGLAFVTQPGSTWTGRALVAGLLGKQLRLLSFAGDRVLDDQPLFVDAYGRLRAVVEAPDGSIWVTTSNRDALGKPGPDDDRILRIVPPAAPTPPGVTPVGRPAPAACPRPRRSARVKTGPLGRRVAKSQRVAQLALRRLRAVEARAEGRPVPRACPRAADPVQATLRQLLITHRIATSALRLHSELTGRLLGRRIAAPAARLRLTGPGRTPATPKQVHSTERIAQLALRRASALAKAVR